MSPPLPYVKGTKGGFLFCSIQNKFCSPDFRYMVLTGLAESGSRQQIFSGPGPSLAVYPYGLEQRSVAGLLEKRPVCIMEPQIEKRRPVDGDTEESYRFNGYAKITTAFSPHQSSCATAVHGTALPPQRRSTRIWSRSSRVSSSGIPRPIRNGTTFGARRRPICSWPCCIMSES